MKIKWVVAYRLKHEIEINGRYNTVWTDIGKFKTRQQALEVESILANDFHSTAEFTVIEVRNAT